MEAFAVFCLVLTSYFPHRWKDLLQYRLLILRTCRQFNGRVWLAYDRASREHAAASHLTDWSSINVQLFNFHAAGASARVPNGSSVAPAEPVGPSSSHIVCKSWNRGRCVAPFSPCRFAHICMLHLFWLSPGWGVFLRNSASKAGKKAVSVTCSVCAVQQQVAYLSNTPTNLCTALLNFLLFCFILYCYAFVQYCYVK